MTYGGLDFLVIASRHLCGGRTHSARSETTRFGARLVRLAHGFGSGLARRGGGRGGLGTDGCVVWFLVSTVRRSSQVEDTIKDVMGEHENASTGEIEKIVRGFQVTTTTGWSRGLWRRAGWGGVRGCGGPCVFERSLG